MDRYTGSTPSTKTVFLIGNFSAHCTEDVKPAIENVEILPFLSNAAPKAQPLSDDTLALMKSKFCRHLHFQVFKNVEAERQSIYGNFFLTATRWVPEDWHALSFDCIRNCFRYGFENLVATVRTLSSQIVLEKQLGRDFNDPCVLYTTVRAQSV